MALLFCHFPLFSTTNCEMHRGVGSGGQGGRLPSHFSKWGANICISPPTFWHGERLKTFCTNFMRYIVLLKLKTGACHSIFGSVFGLKKSRRLLGYQMADVQFLTPPPPHFWRTSYLSDAGSWIQLSVNGWSLLRCFIFFHASLFGRTSSMSDSDCHEWQDSSSQSSIWLSIMSDNERFLLFLRFS